MPYHIDIQHACQEAIPVPDSILEKWVELALHATCETAELTLRFVDLEEITYLNNTYRKQNKPTNVLAFPSNLPKNIELEYPFLGDIVICPAILIEESVAQNKALEAHWALIVIHGVLHLLGYDHIQDNEAIIMQNLEIQLLNTLGFANPYPEHLEDNDFE